MNSRVMPLSRVSEDQPLSLADFPASLIVLRENVKRLVTAVTSGQNFGESFAKLNHDGSWVKTSQGYVQVSLDGSLEMLSETWPRWGIVLDGVAGRLLIAEPPITGNDVSLLPTLTTLRPHDNEKTAGLYLESQNQKDLTYAIAMIPTLTANTGKNTSPGINFDKREKKCQLDGVFMNQVGKRTGLQLQPAFAEWMMGFPIGYTDLPHSEMRSFRNRSTRSSKQLQTLKTKVELRQQGE